MTIWEPAVLVALVCMAVAIKVLCRMVEQAQDARAKAEHAQAVAEGFSAAMEKRTRSAERAAEWMAGQRGTVDVPRRDVS